MGYLFAQILTSLILAAILGFIAGWLARGARGASPEQESQ